jgi:hypothetical protein
MRLTADQKARVFAKYDVCANEAGDKYERVLCEFRESRLNLAICSSELIALDPNAEMRTGFLTHGAQSAAVWLLINETTQEQMQMRYTLFCEFQNSDIINAFPKLSRERNAHTAPALTKITIRTHATWDEFYVQRQRGQLVQFFF